ncbi:MAG: hypothetical protein L0387_24080, partial [Acidobacteria bacterium]|nr:hypothetical protein [Acidobacteriota bacterium]
MMFVSGVLFSPQSCPASFNVPKKVGCEKDHRSPRKLQRFPAVVKSGPSKRRKSPIVKLLLLILGGIALLILVFVAWRYYMTLRGRWVYVKALQKIEPVLKALRVGTTPESADLLRFAENRQTRRVLFETLAEAKRLDLFPR